MNTSSGFIPSRASSADVVARTADLRPGSSVWLDEEKPDLRRPSAARGDDAPWFVPALSALAVLGVVARVLYAVIWETGTVLGGDPKFFEQTAASLFDGQGYAAPFLGRGGPVPTALHPPLFSLVLALLNVVRLESADAHRIALAFICAGSVIVMGLLGRRLMGPAAGLVAAGCAALSPLWIQWGGRLLSESVYLIVIPACSGSPSNASTGRGGGSSALWVS